MSLIHIEGDVTHRKIGAPITDMVLRSLRREGRDIKDHKNYPTLTSDGHKMKSFTSFIRDTQGEIIGAFCINFDISDFMNSIGLLEDFCKVADANEDPSETFASSLNETVDALMDRAVKSMGKLPSAMTKEERVQFVEVLENHGVFLIKGSVELVAQTMGVSRYTIYNYLKESHAKPGKIIS
ncbi:MAG: PAS domain-containing protein [Desulfovibrionales bacterium]|nr:PAS domain-containing protein [Desulfovibrionales bacterium]